MEARWGVSIDVADNGSHAVAAVGIRGMMPGKGWGLSGGGRDGQAIGRRVAVSQIAEN
jgi:hypothetical protein